ncbi:MAG: hypothetical protein K5663_04100 [Clostridiales bacterium]|nr:hypothetical protein [Clostridiales bacterium]
MLSLIIIAAAHFLLLASAAVLARKRRRIFGWGGILFCLLLPLFGPICGLEMIFATEPDPSLLRDMIMRKDKLRRSYVTPGAEAPITAPMEEAFFISAPDVRRKMMMKLLDNDPSNNVELLMMARFNDDPETAHYATATLTEYQRQTEMLLQQSQSLLAKQPDNQEERLNYIRKTEEYISSGLLEGHLLERQRILLKKELDKLPEEQTDMELGCLRIKNLLELRQASEAIEAAKTLLNRFPGREEPWLELMRIYVECRDARGLQKLYEEMEIAGVQWSYAGKEKKEYFLRGLV